MQQIKINGLTIDVVSVYGGKRDMLGAKRDSLAIKLHSDYETVVNTFVDGMAYSLVDISTDDEGNTSTYEYDKSEYSMAGDIVDHRDGTITVHMGKPTELEETQLLLYESMFE